MSDLQLFQDAFAIDFPVEIADQLLGHMQALYGDLFDKKYGEIDPDQLKNTVCKVLNGLNPKDLKRGIDRMNTEKWCPSLPEFRTWCIPASDWWTVDQAWSKSLNFINDNSKPITTLAKTALDEVRQILEIEGQKSAHFAFRDIYLDYLQRAKEHGRVQEFWKAPIPLEEPKIENHKRTQPSPQVAAQIQQIYKNAGLKS